NPRRGLVMRGTRAVQDSDNRDTACVASMPRALRCTMSHFETRGVSSASRIAKHCEKCGAEYTSRRGATASTLAAAGVRRTAHATTLQESARLLTQGARRPQRSGASHTQQTPEGGAINVRSRGTVGGMAQTVAQRAQFADALVQIVRPSRE